MKLGEGEELELDSIDLQILQTLQQDCKIPLARIGDLVGLSAPSVIERIKKLEHGGVIRGYHAVIDGKQIGLDVTAFIGVLVEHPASVEEFEMKVASLEGVLECHHVTGQHTMLLKVKTQDTASLEGLIRQVRGSRAWHGPRPWSCCRRTPSAPSCRWDRSSRRAVSRRRRDAARDGTAASATRCSR